MVSFVNSCTKSHKLYSTMALPNNTTDFASGAQNFYQTLIKMLHGLIVSLKKNIVLFILCMTIGIVPLFVKNMKDGNAYRASFTVMFEELTRKIYGDRLSKLNALVQRDEQAKVAMLLDVDKKMAMSIKSIEAKNILGEDLDKDLNTDRIPFIVEFVTKDSSQVLPLQKAIVKFLETGNEYMADRTRIKNLERNEELEFINNQLRVMDSLNRKGNFQTGSLTVSAGKASDQSSQTYDLSYELYKRKQELLRKERMPGTLMVLDDAIVSEEAKHSLLFVLVVGTAIGLFIYTALVAFLIPAFRYKD